MSSTIGKTFRSFPTTYAALTARHPLRPIHDEKAFDAATEIVMKMAGHALNADQDDYLQVLSDLVHAYDQKHHAIVLQPMTPLEALKYLMDENGMNASELGTLLGQRQLGAKIVSGQRELSKTHISILASRFAVSPALFLAPPSVAKRRATSGATRVKKTSLKRPSPNHSPSKWSKTGTGKRSSVA